MPKRKRKLFTQRKNKQHPSHIRRAEARRQARLNISSAAAGRASPPEEKTARIDSPFEGESQHSPSPIKVESQQSPSSFNGEFQDSPSPFNEEPQQSPSPFNEESQQSRSPFKGESQQSPSPFNEEPQESPSPFNEESQESPSPFEGESQQIPYSFKMECQLSPSLFEVESQHSPSDLEERSSCRSAEKVVQVGESKVDLTDPLSKIGEIMKATLKRDWLVSRRREDLVLSLLNDDAVPTIFKSIVATPDGRVSFYHRGRCLPISHSLCTTRLDLNHIDQVRQTLLNLTSKYESLPECIGASDKIYEYLWERGAFSEKGFPDASQVYRAKDCSVLLEKEKKNKRCKPCQQLMTGLVREHNKKLKRMSNTEKDQSKVNLRFQSKEEIEEALRVARKDRNKFRSEIKVLRSKLEDVENEILVISRPWSEDFLNITKENFEKMTPTQQLFWDQQMKAASLKNKSSMRWHPVVLRMALDLKKISASCYENMRGFGMVTLPSKRTLFDYSRSLSPKEGCPDEITEDLENELDTKCTEPHE